MNHARREDGLALLVTVFLLLVMSAIGLNALNRARDETSHAGTSQAKVKALALADAGVRVLRRTLADRVATSPHVGTVVLDDPNFSIDQYGFRTSLRTGTADSSVAQPVERVGRGAPQGNQLNWGHGATFSYALYRSSVVTTDTGGGNSQVQAQFSVREGKAAY